MKLVMAMTIPGRRLGGRLSKTAKILRKHGAESDCHSQGQGELHIAVAVRRMKGLSPWGSLTLRVATLGKAGPAALASSNTYCLCSMAVSSTQAAEPLVSGHPQFSRSRSRHWPSRARTVGARGDAQWPHSRAVGPIAHLYGCRCGC